MKSIIFPKSAVQLNDEVIVITFSNIGFKKIFFKIQKKAGLACTRQIIVSEEDLDSPNYYRIIGNQSKLHKKKHCFYNDPLIHLETSFYMYLLFCNQNMRSLTNQTSRIQPVAVKRTRWSWPFLSSSYHLQTQSPVQRYRRVFNVYSQNVFIFHMINDSLRPNTILRFFLKADIRPPSLLKETKKYLCLFQPIMGIQIITLQFEKYYIV